MHLSVEVHQDYTFVLSQWGRIVEKRKEEK